MAFVGRSDVADPGAAHHQLERQAQRRERLYAEDDQFRITRPSDAVADAARQPGLRIAEVMATVLQGYAERPALAQRSRQLLTDPETGRTRLKLLPRYQTVTYAQLWARVQSVAAEWHAHAEHRLQPEDFVCLLGFGSIE